MSTILAIILLPRFPAWAAGTWRSGGRLREKDSQKMVSPLLGFAAGVMLAIVSAST